MKAIVIKPKTNSEFKFIASLLKKLGVGSYALSQEEFEDIVMAKLLHEVDKTKKLPGQK
jgi:hypothetical protein